MVKLNCAQLLTKTNWVLLKEGFLFENRIGGLQILKIVGHSFYCTFILLLIISSIVKAFQVRDISVLNQLLCMFISAITVFAKEFALLKHRKCYISMVDDAKSNQVGTLTLRYYIAVAIIFLSVTCVSPFVINMKMMIPPPFNLTRHKYLYNIVHCLVIFYMSINSVSFDVLYVSMLALCVAQLGILQERLSNVSKDAVISIGMKECYVRDDQVFKKCIILHESINEYVKKLGLILSFPLFIQYTCGCVIICNGILQVTLMSETKTTDIISLVAYSCATFGQLVIYHWLGNEIIFKSDSIIESCYLSEWYILNVKSQKLLLLLMERAKRPLMVELYALIYISYESLVKIVRWSYSLFALIKASYN